MKMHCYFLLNVKHGPHSCIWGGLQLSSAGTASSVCHNHRKEVIHSTKLCYLPQQRQQHSVAVF